MLIHWLCFRGFKYNLRYASNWLFVEIVITLQFEYINLSLNLSRSQYLEKLSQHLQEKFRKNKITEERFPSSTMFGMVS